MIEGGICWINSELRSSQGFSRWGPTLPLQETRLHQPNKVKGVEGIEW